MGDISNLADRPVGEVIEAISSADVAPGAGAAGALGLALAAACARKAVTITLKHRHDDAALAKTRDELRELCHRALQGAEEDASRFAAFMHEKDVESAEDLLQAAAGLARSARLLMDLLTDLADRVEPVVRADVEAAKALCQAFSEIATENIDQNRRAAAQVQGVSRRTPT